MQKIKISSIERNILNPRKNFDTTKLQELADSIREVGIIEPLVVSAYQPMHDNSGEYKFRIIAGERRWRAATMAGLDEVPCVVKFDLTAEQEIRLAIIENLQRQDLDPIEEARAYKLLLDTKGYTQESLAKELGVSQGHIANRIRLLELPEAVQENISREIITASHGRVLAGQKNVPSEILEKAAEAIAGENVPVTKAADVVKKLVAEKGMPLFDNYQNKPQFKSGKGSDCYDCEHRAMGARWSNEQEQPYCMNQDCWDKKQAEAIQKKLKKEEDSDVVDIGKLNYNQYEYWHKNSTDYDQTECHDCTKRKLAKDRGGQYYCLDPACMKKKKTAMTKIKNKAAKDAFQVELEKIAELAEGAAIACAKVDIPRQVLIYLAAQIMANIKNDFDRKLTRHLYVKEKFNWQDDVFKGSSYQLLIHDWDFLRARLETLSDQQLWEIIFEWPAVAEGIKGIREWMLEQVEPLGTSQRQEPEDVAGASAQEEPEDTTDYASLYLDNEEEISDRVGWIINNSVGDPNYDSNIPLLTDDELIYCMRHEERKSGLQKLVSEAKKRGIKDLDIIMATGVKTLHSQGEVIDALNVLSGKTLEGQQSSKVTVVVVDSEIGKLTECPYLLGIEGYTDTSHPPYMGIKCKGVKYGRYGDYSRYNYEEGIRKIQQYCRGNFQACEKYQELVNESGPLISAKAQVDMLKEEPKRYLDDKGRELFVCAGIGGKEYGTFWCSHTGGHHRVKSPAMPMVTTEEEAQCNLDAYAEKKGLKRVTEEVSEKVRQVLALDDASEDWRIHMMLLPDEMLQQVIDRETRPSAKSKLRQEARRRAKETA